jgi:hypothetical protein
MARLHDQRRAAYCFAATLFTFLIETVSLSSLEEWGWG